mgnify:CR=1 FL=1|jgi:hypothetical protein
MRAGDLVKITRGSIGVPAGTIGLILESHDAIPRLVSGAEKELIHLLHLTGTSTPRHQRRYLARDLEIINESG